MKQDAGASRAHPHACSVTSTPTRRQKMCFDLGMAVVYKDRMHPDEKPWGVGPTR
jgi:hypothetical protein